VLFRSSQRVGFRKGDIILAVNNAKIATTRDLQTATQERKRYWEITISRDGQVVTSAFGG
jgi:type II secretory pathway component PulC